MISFCLEIKLYKQERRTGFGYGLGDEEKKDTSDNFELHSELGNLRNIAVELIGFLFSLMALLLVIWSRLSAKMRCRVLAASVTAWAEWLWTLNHDVENIGTWQEIWIWISAVLARTTYTLP